MCSPSIGPKDLRVIPRGPVYSLSPQWWRNEEANRVSLPILVSPWSTISAASPMVSGKRLASSVPLRLPHTCSDRVQVVGVGRKPLDQPVALALDERLHGPAAVGRQSVPDEGDLVAVEVTVVGIKD